MSAKVSQFGGSKVEAKRTSAKPARPAHSALRIHFDKILFIAYFYALIIVN